MTDGLEKAIEAAGGTSAALARKIDCTRQAVDQWRKGIRAVSPQKCLQIVAAFPDITLHELRPDIYPE